VMQDIHSGARTEFREVQRSDGSWVKDGPSVRWSREGRKLEEGAYIDDKRDGPWMFWYENGTVNSQESGTYRDGVRKEPMPGPLF